MSSTRTTNVFLAIIAACLVVIAAKEVVPALLPAALAQSSPFTSNRVNAHLHACKVTSSGGCDWHPIVRQQNGALAVSPFPAR
ncbi:hypothetical protein LJR175_008417 [Variovorax sp. LjRoot175]|uniref:hypothetical protein n=1 Tax=Variovorax sp. LjRoot175 TaxID=3342276 RepID=UPI003ECD99D0